MKKTFHSLLLAFFLLVLPLQSLAWGQLGHRIVGQIAETHLNKKARKAIREILGSESLAMSTTWADFIKSDTAYKYLDVWHYVNFEKGLNISQFNTVLAADTTINAYTKLNFLIDQLKKGSLPAETKRMYLRLLVHIVGDIHQPLHVSPVGTAGGNDIKVQWFGTPSNLHRVWDSDLIEMQQLSFTEYAAHLNHTTKTQRNQLQAVPLNEWFYESYSIAQALHDNIKEVNPRLGYRYNYDHINTLNDQLLKGGVRLAGLLNEIFS